VSEASDTRWTIGASPLLRRICLACVEALAVSGVSVSVTSSAGTRVPVFATDRVAMRLEDLQFELGEGPSASVASGRSPVLVADLTAVGAEWPVFAPAALAIGVRAVFAYPLQLGAAQLGVLLLYRSAAEALTMVEQAQALRLSDAAFYAVLDVLSRSSDDPETEQDTLPTDVTAGPVPLYRAEIYQAAGMVMSQLGVSIEEATVRLRAYAYAHDRPLIDVARDIIWHALRLDDDNGPEPPNHGSRHE
jgi:ANTAR domain